MQTLFHPPREKEGVDGARRLSLIKQQSDPRGELTHSASSQKVTCN